MSFQRAHAEKNFEPISTQWKKKKKRRKNKKVCVGGGRLEGQIIEKKKKKEKYTSRERTYLLLDENHPILFICNNPDFMKSNLKHLVLNLPVKAKAIRSITKSRYVLKNNILKDFFPESHKGPIQFPLKSLGFLP